MNRTIHFLWRAIQIVAVALLGIAPLRGQAEQLAAAESLAKLIEGNQRYVANAMARPDQNFERRQEIIKGQHPFAIILCCSDSRVPPEIIFDQGLGDLFIVRTAGNIFDDIALGSLEYAVEHLHVPLLVVLGHSQCGAVSATVAGGHAPGHIGNLVEAITPAVEQAKSQPGDLLDNSVRVNAALAAEHLKASEPIIGEQVRQGRLVVVAAYYDLDSGLVEVLPAAGKEAAPQNNQPPATHP